MSFEKRINCLLMETYESYILVAYDFEGKQVNMRKINNQKDLDALYTALGREEENLVPGSIWEADSDDEKEIF